MFMYSTCIFQYYCCIGCCPSPSISYSFYFPGLFIWPQDFLSSFLGFRSWILLLQLRTLLKSWPSFQEVFDACPHGYSILNSPDSIIFFSNPFPLCIFLTDKKTLFTPLLNPHLFLASLTFHIQSSVN